MQTKLIVYACPVGPSTAQIDAYFVRARREFGHNPAHDYMPHITLTGFFPEARASIVHYTQWLEQAHSEVMAQVSVLPITIVELMLTEQFHGLVIESPWLLELTRRFIARADSPTRPEAIRPKEWLHLSLAYGFRPEEDAPLRALAQASVEPQTQMDWALRLYERRPDPEPTARLVPGSDEWVAQVWECHGEWSLGPASNLG